MPNQPTSQDLQPNPILQNLRLIFSWPLLFAFTLGPILGLLGTCFMTMHFDRIRNVSLIANLPLTAQKFTTLIPGISSFGLALWLSENVKTRLQKEGYVQVRTRAREVDFGINVAVCGAWLYWFGNFEAGKETGWVDQCAKLAIIFVGIDFLLFQLWLGSTVWFTAKAR